MRQLNLAINLPTASPQLYVRCWDDDNNIINAGCVFLDRWVVRMDNDAVTPPGNGLNCQFIAAGYAESAQVRPVSGMPPNDHQVEFGVVITMEPADSFKFPRSGSTHPSLLPGEAGDDDGQVYINQPPEFFALPGARPQKADIRLIRGDAFTFMMSKSPWEINPALTFDWLVSIGQNTNFDGKMVYTPLVPLYPMGWQKAFMAEYRICNTHLLIQGSFVDQSIIDATVALARSMGVWAMVFDTNAQRLVTRIQNKTVDFPVLGLEVNNELDPQGILDAITAVCAVKPKGMPFGPHFTSTGGPGKEHNYAFPVPPMDYIPWWAMIQRLGVTHSFYEAWMDYNGDMDSAGRMGSFMFYARVVLCHASRLNPDLDQLLLCAAEIMSAPPFMDKVDADFSHRRAAEMVCCPNSGYPDMPGVCGSLNGGMLDITTGKAL